MNAHHQLSTASTSSTRLCYCTIGCTGSIEHANVNYTVCRPATNAACYHMKMYERDTATPYEEWGCLHRELDDADYASPMQCNGWRPKHYHPTTINCCYTTSLCNLNGTLPPISNPHIIRDALKSTLRRIYEDYPILTAVILLLSVAVIVMTIVVGCLVWRRRRRHQTKRSTSRLSNTGGESAQYTDNGGASKRPLIAESDDSQLTEISSGRSGAIVNIATIASQVRLCEMVGRGRYGEVYKALWKGDSVAVKVFFTWEEASWKREVAIYKTDMLNHPNILAFIAADISSIDHSTSMLVITAYQANGSLHDYLKRTSALHKLQALRLAHSSIEGIRYLHEEIIGHGCHKPAIAHRDIKSRNILVKCDQMTACIADFGLAIKRTSTGDIETLPGEQLNIQVGTRRYMSPEVLNGTISVHSFDAFKMSDVYSWALVLWEIARRIEAYGGASSSTAAAPASSQSSGIGASIESAAPTSSGIEFPQQSVSGSGIGGSQGTAYPYLTPFEDQGLPLMTDPSIEVMRDIVCVKRLRPIIPTEWTDAQRSPHWLLELSRTMRACWSHKASARLSAMRIKLDLAALIKQMWSDEQRTQSVRVDARTESGLTV